MNNPEKPVLAITMGDPAGTGPEIIAKTVAEGKTAARLVCIGDAASMEKAFYLIKASHRVNPIHTLAEARFQPGTLDVYDLGNVDHSRLVMGAVQAAAGKAAYAYITTAIDLALEKQVAGVVTCAIHKEALHLAGCRHAGHTEIFAERTGTKKVTMMLAAGHFRVTHVSTHCSLREAVERCKTPRILEVIHITHNALLQMGIAHPRLAVAGLNPHSGEGGLFGREEIEQIQPAIDAARAEGLAVYPAPLPGDTVFLRMQRGKEFDAVVAQYHDQGHIAAKLVDFFGGVNITLGLPIIRTSVDHGTAFDIAGKGIANPNSLLAAIEYARLMAAHRPNAGRIPHAQRTPF